jgi:hypothetical protein
MPKTNHKTDAYEDPVWLKWRCDFGSRWTTVKGSPNSDEGKCGDRCEFSGCAPAQHSAHIVGETSDRTEAHDWFHAFAEDTFD